MYGEFDSHWYQEMIWNLAGKSHSLSRRVSIYSRTSLRLSLDSMTGYRFITRCKSSLSLHKNRLIHAVPAESSEAQM